MAVIYIEKAGIKFSLEDGHRTVSLCEKTDLAGIVYVESAGYKKYDKDPEKIAHKVYKNKSYIIDGNTVYLYPALDLGLFNAELSPYQILINNFLRKKGIAGNVLLLDGSKAAVILSLIINEEFKQISISNSKVINESVSEIKKYLAKEKIKLDKVIINDEFYRPAFKSAVTSLDETEILEFAQGFNASVFKKIEDIQKKLKLARDKKLNFILAVASVIFAVSTGGYLYTLHINNKYTVLNNGLRLRIGAAKQKLNLEIERKFLTKVRVNVAKNIGFTLLNLSSVANIKINTVSVSGGQFTITGRILGGYRNFVKGYNSLKNIALKIGDKAEYAVSDTGKTSWTVKGAIR